jgi:hypothetical protein
MDSGVYGTQIIDFISGNLTVAGMIVNVFFTLITSLFIVVMLRIVYIDMDSGKVLFLIEQLGTQIIDFISGDLTVAGMIVNVFQLCYLLF